MALGAKENADGYFGLLPIVADFDAIPRGIRNISVKRRRRKSKTSRAKVHRTPKRKKAKVTHTAHHRGGKKRPYPYHLKKYFFKKKR